MAAAKRKLKPSPEEMYTVMVDNMPDEKTEAQIRSTFTEFGEIGDLFIPTNSGTGKRKPFLFVRFLNKKDQLRAQGRMNGTEIDGAFIKVKAIPNKKESYNKKNRSPSPVKNSDPKPKQDPAPLPKLPKLAVSQSKKQDLRKLLNKERSKERTSTRSTSKKERSPPPDDDINFTISIDGFVDDPEKVGLPDSDHDTDTTESLDVNVGDMKTTKSQRLGKLYSDKAKKLKSSRKLGKGNYLPPARRESGDSSSIEPKRLKGSEYSSFLERSTERRSPRREKRRSRSPVRKRSRSPYTSISRRLGEVERSESKYRYRRSPSPERRRSVGHRDVERRREAKRSHREIEREHDRELKSAYEAAHRNYPGRSRDRSRERSRDYEDDRYRPKRERRSDSRDRGYYKEYSKPSRDSDRRHRERTPEKAQYRDEAPPPQIQYDPLSRIPSIPGMAAVPMNFNALASYQMAAAYGHPAMHLGYPTPIPGISTGISPVALPVHARGDLRSAYVASHPFPVTTAAHYYSPAQPSIPAYTPAPSMIKKELKREARESTRDTDRRNRVKKEDAALMAKYEENLRRGAQRKADFVPQYTPKTGRGLSPLRSHEHRSFDETTPHSTATPQPPQYVKTSRWSPPREYYTNAAYATHINASASTISQAPKPGIRSPPVALPLTKKNKQKVDTLLIKNQLAHIKQVQKERKDYHDSRQDAARERSPRAYDY